MAVISACLPTMKPLLHGILGTNPSAQSPDPNNYHYDGFGHVPFRKYSDSSEPSSTRSAHWRSVANEKRICNLDTSEFRRCDEQRRAGGGRLDDGGDSTLQMAIPRSALGISFDGKPSCGPYGDTDPSRQPAPPTRTARGLMLNNGMVVVDDGTPHLYGWDGARSAV